MKRFVYLEFSDPKLRKFLTDLRKALTGEEDFGAIHITVRGPYEEAPNPLVLEKLGEAIGGYGIVLGGAGIFETPHGYAVFLKAQSPVFSQLWWKRDFPQSKFGREPHITIFESNNKSASKAVESFLKSERIEIFTFGFKLTVHASKQLSLFERSVVIASQPNISWQRWKVRPGILQRAKQLRGNLIRNAAP